MSAPMITWRSGRGRSWKGCGARVGQPSASNIEALSRRVCARVVLARVNHDVRVSGLPKYSVKRDSCRWIESL